MKKLFIVFFLMIIPASIIAQEWYEGGDLHNKSALEWQEASYENKLATCADFVAVAWQNDSLSPKLQSKITSMDDVKLLSKELVIAIDEAFKKEGDAEKNKMIFTNQKVSESAVILMLMMGWIKK